MKDGDKGSEGSCIGQCSCEHKGQDAIHGRGQRVHNICKEGKRCTVCGKVSPRNA